MRFFTKNKNLLLLVLVAIFAISFAACDTTETNDTEPITLSLAHFFPGTHPAETVLVQGWAEKLEEETDGKIIIESFPGGSLFGATDIYNGVVEGGADIGLSCFAYNRGRFPVLEAFELPGIIYKNSKSASMVAWDGIQELDPEEVQDTKLLMVIATGPGDLMTKEPVRNLDDLQGMEIRATGLSEKAINALGGIAIAMPQSETYESLSKNIVKGNVSPIEVLKGWSHAEVTGYITKTPFIYNTLFYVTMNLEQWDAIPADLQEIILDVTADFYEEVGIGLWDSQNETALTWAIDEQDIEVIELDAEEQKLWLEKVMPVQDEFIESLDDAEDILDTIQDLAEKYNEVY